MKPFKLSVKALIDDGRGRYLVLRRSASSKANAGKWDFPGGKLDPGESLDTALAREVEEETGLTVVVERVAGSAQSESATARIAYLLMACRYISGEVVLSEEHDDYAWVERRELSTIELCEQFSHCLPSN